MSSKQPNADGDKKEKSKKKKNNSRNSKYNYDFGKHYPGIVKGHKQCNPFPVAGYNVPYNMGWLWTSSDQSGLKKRRGWRPGAIGKSMMKVMTFKLPRGTEKKEKKTVRRRRRYKSGGDTQDSEPDEPLEPKAALRVNRKGDVYTIEVNPLRDLTQIDDHEDPYIDCDPMVFKIIKKRTAEEQAKSEAKKLARQKKQRDEEIKKALSEAVEDICKCAYMDVYCNDLSALDKVIDKCPAFEEPDCICKSESLSSLSSHATWDIEYTPPFGCFDLTPKKKRVFVHTGTQYRNSDLTYEPVTEMKKPGKKR